MRRIAFTLFAVLSGIAAAKEGDASHAHPQRWTHTTGPAAANQRSNAKAPRSLGGVLWTHTAKKGVLAPPVTWDGSAFLLEGNSSSADLIALDVVDGKVLARTPVKGLGPAPRPATYARSVFLLERGTDLVQYELAGRKFVRRWSRTLGADASPPRIFLGEIYVATPEGLVRLRTGATPVVWKQAGIYTGEAAVFGDHVYALRRTDSDGLAVAVHQRTDGKLVALVEAAKHFIKGGSIAVAEQTIGVGLAPEAAGEWSIATRTLKDGIPQFQLGRTEKFRSRPLIGRSLIVGETARPHAWTLMRFGKQPRRPWVHAEERPDLFDGAASCVGMGPVLCFGSWAGDFSSNSLLWHLNEIKGLESGVRFRAVPAAHQLLLVVSRDGKSVHAIGPEEFER